MDYEMLKKVVLWTSIGAAVGIGGTIFLMQMGISYPVVVVLMVAGVSACSYMEIKANHKKEQEALTAVWQQAYKAGFDEALKQKAG